MNKKWLLSIALLAFMVPTLHLCAMEDLSAEAVYSGVAESEDGLAKEEEATIEEDNSDEFAQQMAQEIKNAPFLEKIQVYDLPSPDGLLVAKCTYKIRESSSCFVDQKDLERCAGLGYYPWHCHINICMADGDEKDLGGIVGAGVLLRKMEWLDGNQLRILAAELTDVRQLKWHDCVYALDGTLLNNGMDDTLRALFSRAVSIQSAQRTSP